MTDIRQINVPREASQIALRVPSDLHKRLQETASQQAISVNTLIASVLADFLGWHEPPPTPPPEPKPIKRPGRKR